MYTGSLVINNCQVVILSNNQSNHQISFLCILYVLFPQYSTYYGLSYNKLINDIKSGISITGLIKCGKEYRILC